MNVCARVCVCCKFSVVRSHRSACGLLRVGVLSAVDDFLVSGLVSIRPTRLELYFVGVTGTATESISCSLHYLEEVSRGPTQH